MYVSLVDFARKRGYNPDTVSTFVRRHPEVEAACDQSKFDETFIQTNKKDKYIDTEHPGYRVLNERYPEITDLSREPELLQQIEVLQKKVDALTASNLANEHSIREMVQRNLDDQLKIEEKQDRIIELEKNAVENGFLRAEIEKKDNLIEEKEKSLNEANTRLQELEAALAAEKSKSIWQKLFGK